MNASENIKSLRIRLEQGISDAEATIEANKSLIQLLQKTCIHPQIKRVGDQQFGGDLLEDCPFCGKRKSIPVG